MMERILSPKEVRQLQKRYQELQSEIAQLGSIAQAEPNAQSASVGTLLSSRCAVWR